VLSYACKLAKLPPVQPSSADRGGGGNVMGAARGGSKRVMNDKVKLLLGSAQRNLLYPDYRRYADYQYIR
jgi:hypothetical protein